MFFGFWSRISTAAVIFLFSFSVYSFTMLGWFQYGGEIEKYRVAQSIVDRQSLTIRPIIAERGATGVGGQTYSIYEMGQTLLEVPFYALGRIAHSAFPTPDVNSLTLLAVGLLNPLLTALTCVVLYLTCLSLGFRDSTALASTLLFGFSTIAWSYSRGFDREPAMGLLILLSFFSSYQFAKTGADRWLVLAGLFSGYLVFTKLIQAMVVPFFLAYIIAITYLGPETVKLNVRAKAVTAARRIFLFVLPSLVFLGIQAVYAFLRFGTLYSGVGGSKRSVVEVILSELAHSQPLAAVTGLLFSIDRSIFVFSPPAILFLVFWFLWFKRQPREASLVLGLVLIEFLSTIGRWEWWGGPRWGPRYLVQITPLLLIPLGMIDSLSQRARRLWASVGALLFAVGFLIQGIGVLTNERDGIDITAKNLSIAGQLDFLRHGALESLVLYLAPAGLPLQVNPFGILVVLVAVLLGAWIVWRMRHAEVGLPVSRRLSLSLTLLVLLVEFAAGMAWIVAPYSQVLGAKADSKFVAANSFLAEGRTCEASALYRIAIARGTTYQPEAFARLSQLDPQPRGTLIAAGDLLAEVENPDNALVEEDDSVTITRNGSFKASAAQGADVIVRGHASPIPVLSKTTYEVSGWIKTEDIYGEGYGAVTVYEDDGAFRKPRGTDIVLGDETNGWTRFQKTLTTLPTTRRLFVAAGLWKTAGTVWIDGLSIAQITSDNPPSAEIKPCN